MLTIATYPGSTERGSPEHFFCHFFSYYCDKCPTKPAPGGYGCPSLTVMKYVEKLASNGPVTVCVEVYCYILH